MTVQPPADKPEPRPSSSVRATVSIFHPDAAEISLQPSVYTPGSYFLTLTPDFGSISLGGPTADREADAQAMDRLAEVATEAAAKLRTLPADQPTAGA